MWTGSPVLGGRAFRRGPLCKLDRTVWSGLTSFYDRPSRLSSNATSKVAGGQSLGFGQVTPNWRIPAKEIGHQCQHISRMTHIWWHLICCKWIMELSPVTHWYTVNSVLDVGRSPGERPNHLQDCQLRVPLKGYLMPFKRCSRLRTKRVWYCCLIECSVSDSAPKGIYMLSVESQFRWEHKRTFMLFNAVSWRTRRVLSP